MKVAFVLGRQDRPTDGVRDYCAFLLGAWQKRGHEGCVMEVRWAEEGWVRAIRRLRSAIAPERVDWAVLQVTHLMWSRRGIPLGALVVARALRGAGVRVAVVIHDPGGFPGSRVRDRIRRAGQYRVMRALLRTAERTFVTVAPERASWMSMAEQARACLLPVGPNILPESGRSDRRGDSPPFTVAVFGVTEGQVSHEAATIAAALTRLSREIGKVKLVTVGRGTREAAPLLRNLVENAGVEVVVRGIAPAPEVSETLARADALLFARAPVSSRRTTVVAAIAHGLPVVGFDGSETAWPITEAGVVLCEPGDVNALATSLARLARDAEWAGSLRDRNVKAYVKHFAWERIAERLEKTLASAG